MPKVAVVCMMNTCLIHTFVSITGESRHFTMVTTDTRQRLLDVAEGLFADQGLKGTSLRAITLKAEANLAAVNYHFGTKEGLFAAVFQRRIGPMTVERIRLLDQALEAAAPDAPALEDVLRGLPGADAGAADITRPGGSKLPAATGASVLRVG